MNEEDLQVVLVRYGSDTGLISLAVQTILCHTVDAGDGGLEWPKAIPVIDFSDEGKFTVLLGQNPEEPEHNWDDVLAYVLGHAKKLGLTGHPDVPMPYEGVNMTEQTIAIDRALDALARHIDEQRSDDEDAPVCIHVRQAYDILAAAACIRKT